MWLTDLVKYASSVSDLKTLVKDEQTAYDVFKNATGTTAERLAEAEKSLYESDFREILIPLIQKFTDDATDANVAVAINALGDALAALANVETTSATETTTTTD